ncbi:MAG: CotH kinase family protein, partial [Clostridia bacterium]|nr:CotH kinase family protein [Clostridia bacterium]
FILLLCMLASCEGGIIELGSETTSKGNKTTKTSAQTVATTVDGKESTTEPSETSPTGGTTEPQSATTAEQTETTNQTTAKTTSAKDPDTTARITKDTKAPVTTKEDKPAPTYVVNGNGFIINEVMVSNDKYYAVNGNYYDLAELKNDTGSSIKLSDYYLTDNAKKPKKWNLPDKTLGAGELYVAILSGNGGDQANFKISSGETLYLMKADGTCVDSMETDRIPYNYSKGVSGGSVLFFDTPTIGKENGNGKPLSNAPTASKAPGNYTSAFSVTLSGEGDIYYTTDGSDPASKGKKYDGSAISVSNITTVRAYSLASGKYKSETVTFSYFVNDKSKLPVMKVSIDKNDMFGSEGIYTKYNSGEEKNANLSFFIDGKQEFSINCGISITGSTSKKEAKKSFKVKFRSKFGSSSLRYKMFENLDIKKFDALVLRGGSQDWYGAMMRDELMTSLAGDAAGNTMLVQAYRPCSLYINDEYFGIYYIRERINPSFVSSHLGGDPEDAAIIKYGSALENGTKEDQREWNELVNYIKTMDKNSTTAYEYVCSKLDVKSLADWYIARAYAGDLDIDNIRYCRVKGGKWTLIFFDLDLGFWGTKTPLTRIAGELGKYNVPFYYLMKVPQFNKLVKERAAMHMKYSYNDETVLKRIDEIEKMLEPEMERNCDRWDDAEADGKKTSYFNVNYWKSMVNYLRKVVNKDGVSRTQAVLDDLKNF